MPHQRRAGRGQRGRSTAATVTRSAASSAARSAASSANRPRRRRPSQATATRPAPNGHGSSTSSSGSPRGEDSRSPTRPAPARGGAGRVARLVDDAAADREREAVGRRHQQPVPLENPRLGGLGVARVGGQRPEHGALERVLLVQERAQRGRIFLGQQPGAQQRAVDRAGVQRDQQGRVGVAP
jgi:hypothetical protein